jgi:regulator of nucleoside diphosphate kinase
MTMNQNTIYLTHLDFEQMSNFIRLYKLKNNRKDNSFIQLERILANAVITAPEKIPANIITLNSRFRIKNISDGKEYTYTLVLPMQANISEMKLSLFSPLGIALLGHAEGDNLEYETAAGKFEYHLEEILYQPEWEGNFTR